MGECIKNSERLSKDSEVVSEPTKSALLELAFEEASKAYWIANIYLDLFKVENRPYWAKLVGYAIEFKRQSRKKQKGMFGGIVTRLLMFEEKRARMNILYSIFREHDLKILLPLLGVKAINEFANPEEDIINAFKSIGISEEKIRDKRPQIKEYISYIQSYKKIDFNKIKMNGFYVDFEPETLNIYKPSQAKASDIEEIKRNIEISIRNVKELLMVLG